MIDEKNKEFLEVFVSEIPKGQVPEITDRERLKEISSVKDGALNKEMSYAFSVLEYALKNQGLTVDEIKLTKNENGKYVANGVNVSLSHSRGIVAVAVSSTPCGIDVESAKREDKKLLDKILVENEKTPNFGVKGGISLLSYFWTRKESVFKKYGEKIFSPSKIDTSVEKVNSYLLRLKNPYVVSVACDSLSKIKINGLSYEEDFKNYKIDVIKI